LQGYQNKITRQDGPDSHTEGSLLARLECDRDQRVSKVDHSRISEKNETFDNQDPRRLLEFDVNRVKKFVPPERFREFSIRDVFAE
jgi:hypothetical protein